MLSKPSATASPIAKYYLAPLVTTNHSDIKTIFCDQCSVTRRSAGGFMHVKTRRTNFVKNSKPAQFIQNSTIQDDVQQASRPEPAYKHALLGCYGRYDDCFRLLSSAANFLTRRATKVCLRHGQVVLGTTTSLPESIQQLQSLFPCIQRYSAPDINIPHAMGNQSTNTKRIRSF